MTAQTRAYSGCRALIMGLGLHGGGLESAKFLARQGAELTVTDMRSADDLRASVEALDAFAQDCGAPPVRYVLGRHDHADFSAADLVLKNPGVRPDSPYLRGVRALETDISLFLQNNPATLIGVTGSKGKSFTASALHAALTGLCAGSGRQAYLGGNITVSPLTFVDALKPDDYVVLELSSFQLGDLSLTPHWDGGALLKPRVAVFTAIMSDHQDRYGSMEAYIADKKLLYAGQDQRDATVSAGGSWGSVFLAETAGRPLCSCNADEAAALMAAGAHREYNVRNALRALADLGFDSTLTRRLLDDFPGIEHRMEFFVEHEGVRYYNDSAATIPEAAAACCRNLRSLILVTGGTDKNLDFSPLADALTYAKAVLLLAGSGSDKLAALLDERHIPYAGPFASLDAAVHHATGTARPGDAVALSPGCASFGMFRNEFDRGRQWKDAVRQALTLAPR